MVLVGGLVDPDVGLRERKKFGEGAGAVDADALGVGAEVAPAGEAVAAVAADDVALAGDDVAFAEVVDVGSGADDPADELVADDHRDGDGLLRPGVPVVNVHVGAADAGAQHLDEAIVDPHLRDGHVLQPEADVLLPLDQRPHRFLHG